MQVSTPRRTGSFEISCGLPTGKVVSLPAALRALPRVRGPPRVCCARGPDPATGWKRDRQSQPAPHDFTLATRELRLGQVGGTCGPTPTPICCDRGRGCPSWGRCRPQGAVSGRANPRGGTAGGRAAGPSPGSRQTRLPARPAPRRRHSPKKPCTIPSGWLSQSSPHGISPGAGAGVDRAEAIRGQSAAGRPAPSSSSAARPLLARALPRTASGGARASRASGSGGCGGAAEELLATGKRARTGP